MALTEEFRQLFCKQSAFSISAAETCPQEISGFSGGRGTSSDKHDEIEVEFTQDLVKLLKLMEKKLCSLF